MKILFVAAPSSFNTQVQKAFLKNGIDFININERANFILSGLLKNNNLLWKIIRKSSYLKKANNQAFNRQLLEYCSHFKPDFLFTTKGTIIGPETLLKIKGRGIRTINWFPENVYHPLYKNWFLRTYSFYDYFLAFDSSLLENFQSREPKTKIFYIPFGVDPAFYQTPLLIGDDVKKYSCDVCFAGALYPERERLLRTVVEMGVEVKIFGWKDWLKSGFANYYFGPLNTPEMSKLFQCAKICLNSNLKPADVGANLRTFEIPAAGGFQLSDNQKDLANLFKIGEEIAVYNNEYDLKDKITFYLREENLRKQIAKAGRGRVLRDHTLDKRVKDIFELIRTNPPVGV